jgi:heme a synthase
MPTMTLADGKGSAKAALPAVAIWLWLVALLVFAMIVVGGATRLTDSGLSITEWRPLLGAIPPLNDAHWLEAFEKYRQIPEYDLVNKGMSLEDFKFIYWWEWSHRFLGRLIGVVFALPLLVFWMSGRLRAGLPLKLAGVLALGGLQGAIGWYMVQSGLADRVDVSQYRLALHLTTAFVILGLLVWLALETSDGRSATGAWPAGGAIRYGAAAIVGLVLLQVVLGAFVAGLKAGLVYNTWPDMNGAIVPPDYWTTTPAYLSIFESHAATQFNHRMTAYLVGAAALVQSALLLRGPADHCSRVSGYALVAAVFAQMVIGIATLLSAVPLSLGLLHQGGGAIVLAIAVWHFYSTRRSGAQASPSMI